MQEVDNLMKKQRGCFYCLDYQKRRYKGVRKRVCIHDQCPYHELDKHKSYREYLKNEAPKIPLHKMWG